jgi:1-acyl-sn-glycerol-3-phosphate acyltransferase
MLTAIVSVFFYIVVLVWSLAVFGVMLVLYVLTVPFDRERIVLHAVSRMWARSLFWLNPLWKLKVYGLENVDPSRAYVITVNHQSFLDIPLMYAIRGINFKWVAKTWVYRIPLFGAVMWLHGDITVSEKGSVRMTKVMMDKGKKHLSAGTSVIIFPEGTRSQDGEIHRFKDGAFTLAREAGVPVLPCVINGAKDYLNGWRVRKNVFEISIMSPIDARVVKETPARELREEVREKSVVELARLRERNKQ